LLVFFNVAAPLLRCERKHTDIGSFSKKLVSVVLLKERFAVFVGLAAEVKSSPRQESDLRRHVAKKQKG